MPRIPQLTPTVSSQPTQARFTVRASDMGQSMGRGLQNAASVLSKYAEEEKKKANSIAVMEADRRLSEWETRNIYDAENGALNKNGRDAFGLPDELLPDLETTISEIESSLANDDQKLAFTRIAASRRQDVDRILQRHIASEREVYDKEQTDAYLSNSLESASNNYNDPERIALELDRQEGAILDWAERNGVSADVVKARLEGMTSKTHAAVIERMLNDGHYRGATEYFQANRDDIQSEEAAAAEKLIREQTVRGESQDRADQIMGESQDLQSALKAAREIDDREVRDATIQRIKARHDENNAIRSQQARERRDNAYNTVEKTGSVDAIPAEDWAELDAETRRGLEIRSRQVRSGIEPVTDWETYYDLKREAVDNPNSFADRNLIAQRPNLSDAEFKELTAAQAAIRAGRSKTDDALAGFRTVEQVAKDTLNAVGIDPTPEGGSAEAKKVSAFRRQLDQAVIDWKRQNGKKEIPTEEVQRIADRLVIEGEVIGGGFMGAYDPDMRRFEAKPGDRFEVTDIDEIPSDERRKIEEALRRRELPLEDQSILRLYNEKLARELNE